MDTVDAAAKVALGSRDLAFVLSMTSVARSSSSDWEGKRPAWNAVFGSVGLIAGNAMVSDSPLLGTSAEREVNRPALACSGWGILGSDVFGSIGGVIGAAVGSTVAVITTC